MPMNWLVGVTYGASDYKRLLLAIWNIGKPFIRIVHETLRRSHTHSRELELAW